MNSDRKIIRGVRVGSKTYVAGMEDELDAALTSDEVKRLTDKGYLEGKFSGKAQAVAPTLVPEIKEAKKPAKEK